MKYSIYIIYLILFLLSCGNSSHNSPVTDYSDSIMDSPNTYDSITAPVSTTVPQTNVQETNYVPQTHTVAPTESHTMMVTNSSMQMVKRMAIPIVATKPVLTAPMSTVAKLQMTMSKAYKGY